jgi:hypothetical protein
MLRGHGEIDDTAVGFRHWAGARQQDDVAGESSVAYFVAMLQYHSNPADPEALALLQGMSGSLSLPGG